MKFAFNIFIFLAVSAFAAEIAYSFVEKATSETTMKSNDSDPDSDDDTSPDEEDQDFDKLELYFTLHNYHTHQPIVQRNASFFGYIQHSSGFHFCKPPFSPPELM